MADRTGEQLGNYRIIRQLGRGGFADVYLGEHLYLNTKAAIKVLQTRLADNDLPGFLNEARTIAGLTHTRIVRILDFGVEDDIPFLVMEYAPNGTLRQRYPKGTRIPLVNIVPYVKQVAEALQFAHDRRLIHRDIKPENMLLNQQYEVLLSDFGIAVVSQTSRPIETQPVVGTAAYMAPEQLQGKPRPASDQYALAIVAYEWLTGDLPFHGTFTEVASQHLFVPPAPLRSKIPDIAHDVEQIMQIALSKDPQHRFMSVQAFAMALEQASASPSSSMIAPFDNSPTVLVTPSPPPFQVHVSTPSPAPNIYSASALNNLPDVREQISQPGIADSPIREPQPSQRGISRRMVLIGLAGLVVGGGITGVALSQRFLSTPPSPAGSPTTVPTRSATKTPVSTPSTVPPFSTLGNTLYVYNGHSQQVTTVEWLPGTAQTIASGSEDKTVKIWNAINGTTLMVKTHSKQVYTLASSPNGQFIVSGGSDPNLLVWDVNTGSIISTYSQYTKQVYASAWLPDGQRVVTGGADNTAQVWNASSGTQLFTYNRHSNTVWALAWSPPNGQYIASASLDGTVQIWDATTGSTNFIYRDNTGQGVRAVAWSFDGQYIASGGDGSTVQVWAASSGKIIYTYNGHSDHVEDVKWSSDGRRIASASLDGTVQIWDAMTGNNAYMYKQHAGGIWAITWSSDGKLIASASKDNTVRVWSAV